MSKLYTPLLHEVNFTDSAWKKLAIGIVRPTEHAPPNCRFAITLADYFIKWRPFQLSALVSTSAVNSFALALFSRASTLRKLLATMTCSSYRKKYAIFLVYEVYYTPHFRFCVPSWKLMTLLRGSTELSWHTFSTILLKAPVLEDQP